MTSCRSLAVAASLLAFACSSETKNQTSSTGGSAGAATGGSGGASGGGGTGGTAGASGSSGAGGSAGQSSVPKLGSAVLLAVPANQYLTDVAVSPIDGHVFVLGDGSFNGVQTAFLAEADGTGEVGRREFTSSADLAFLMGLTIGSNGALYLSGMYQGSLTYPPGTTVNDPGGWGATTARIMPGTPDTVVAYTYAGPNDQALHANARFQSGSVSVGMIQGTVKVNTVDVVADAVGDALIAAEFAGANNVHTLFGGSGKQDLFGVATNSSNDVVVAGESGDATSLQVYGTGAQGQIAMILSYHSGLGTPAWTAAIGSAGNDNFHDVAISPANGDVVAVGWVYGSVNAGPMGQLDYVAGEDIVVACFQSNGTPRWAKAFGGGADDRAYALAISKSGDIFVTGSIKSVSVDFGTGTLTKKGSEDGFLLRLDADGQTKWASLIGGDGADHWGAATAREDGSIVLAGTIEGPVDLLGTTIQSSADAGALADVVVLTLEP
jgi:hypothetical protein